MTPLHIYAVADLHLTPHDPRLIGITQAVVEAGPDVIIDCGDHTTFGTGGEGWRLFLQEQTSQRKVLMVGGNHECDGMTRELLRIDCPDVVLLSDLIGGVMVQDVLFVGCDSFWYAMVELPRQSPNLGLNGSMDWETSNERRAYLAQAGVMAAAAKATAQQHGAREVVVVSHYPPVRLARVHEYMEAFPEEMDPSYCEMTECLCRELRPHNCLHGHFHMQHGIKNRYLLGCVEIINPGPSGLILEV